jgi:4-amino-4-deoxy-L-arabinose transferase-like glycosyltransferase
VKPGLTVALANVLERPAIILPLIVILALAVRLTFFTGLSEVDDYNYAKYAHEIANGEFNLWGSGQVTGGLQRFRFSILLPVAFSFATLGVSNFTAILWPLVCSLGSIILIFYLGKQFGDEGVGLLAAFLYSLFPLDVVYATRLLPEAILPLFTGLSVFLFLRADASPARGRAYLYFILAGVLLGVAYFVRVSAVLILLFFGVYVLYRRKLRKEYFLPVATFLLFVLLEVSLYYLKTGDLLYRFHELQANNAHWKALGMNAPAGYYFQQLFGNDLLKYFYCAIFFATSYLLLSKQSVIHIALLWMVSLFIFLEYAPIYKEARFLSIITMPALLVLSTCLCALADDGFCKRLIFTIACTFLMLLVSRQITLSLKQLNGWVTTPFLLVLVLVTGFVLENQRVRKVALGVSVLLLGVSCFHPSAVQAQRFQSWERPYTETFDHLSDLPERVLYCADAYTAIKLDFFHRYGKRCRQIDGAEDVSAIETAYLVIDLRRENAQTLIQELPQNWRVLQRVYAGANVPQFAIYSVVSRQDAEREVDQLEQSTREIPLDATQYLVWGSDYMVLERWEDAVRAYTQAVVLRPSDAEARSDLIAASIKYVESNWQEMENKNNLLINPSFEQGAMRWRMHRPSGEGAVFAVREGVFLTGTQGALIEGLTEGYHGGWYQKLQITETALYLFSCRVMTEDDQGLQGKILYWESYAGGQPNGHWAEEFSGSMEWTYKWTTFVAPESDDGIVAFYPVLVSGVGRVWIDDIRLVELGDSEMSE